MKLRTFLARDMREALASVRSEMGDDAVIVASEKAKGGGIMVRAALDEPDAVERALTPDEPITELEKAIEAPASLEDSFRGDLMKRLRGAPQSAKTPLSPFSRAELLTVLRGHRLPDNLAHDFAKTAENSGLKDMTLALASALDRRMKTQPLDISKTAALLLVGPNGAGKTAIAAKIAAHARLSHRHVLFVATDIEGAGALARLEAFAGHLRLKVEIAETAEALAKIVAQCSDDNALVIIDTAGFDLRNPRARTAFSALAMIEGVEALGVVSACGDAEETVELISSLQMLGAQRLIVTQMDMARRFGALAAASCSGLGLAHITRSPFVAGGLETLTPLSLARTLLEGATRNADQGSTQ
jgi:flagellar biosynthesis protein FlhF